MADVRLLARCFPTEERERVVRAFLGLFPDAVFDGDDPITAQASSTETFADTLKRQKIRSAARSVMLKGLSGNETHFRLNKQVATIGKVSFSDEEHPLGDIEVTIASADITKLIDSITLREREDGSQ